LDHAPTTSVSLLTSHTLAVLLTSVASQLRSTDTSWSGFTVCDSSDRSKCDSPLCAVFDFFTLGLFADIVVSLYSINVELFASEHCDDKRVVVRR